jgi:hypothetical protein
MGRDKHSSGVFSRKVQETAFFVAQVMPAMARILNALVDLISRSNDIDDPTGSSPDPVASHRDQCGFSQPLNSKILVLNVACEGLHKQRPQYLAFPF